MKLKTLLLALSIACFACEVPTDKKVSENTETKKSGQPEDIKAEAYKPEAKNLPLYKVEGEIIGIYHHTNTQMRSLDTDYIFYKTAQGFFVRSIYPDGSKSDSAISFENSGKKTGKITYKEEGSYNGEYFVLQPTVLELYNKENRKFADALPFDLP